MKKFLFAVVAVCCFAVSTANAQVNLIFSTSDTDANAGNVLNLMDGGSGSLFVWLQNNDSTEAVLGAEVDIFGAGLTTVTADAYTIDPTPWAGLGDNVLGSTDGLLVDGANAVAIPPFAGNGIAAGETVLFSQLDLSVNGLGETTLEVQPGALGVGLESGLADVQNGFASVISTGGGAIPEPSAACLIGAMFGGVLLRRRRSV